MNFVDLGDTKNLIRNILKNLLLVSRNKRKLFCIFRSEFFTSSTYKKKVFFKYLSEWFDVHLLKGDEKLVNYETPILIFDPRTVPSEVLKFISNEKSRVILLWDPYQLVGERKETKKIDKNFKKVIKNEGIYLNTKPCHIR